MSSRFVLSRFRPHQSISNQLIEEISSLLTKSIHHNRPSILFYNISISLFSPSRLYSFFSPLFIILLPCGRRQLAEVLWQRQMSHRWPHLRLQIQPAKSLNYLLYCHLYVRLNTFYNHYQCSQVLSPFSFWVSLCQLLTCSYFSPLCSRFLISRKAPTSMMLKLTLMFLILSQYSRRNRMIWGILCTLGNVH